MAIQSVYLRATVYFIFIRICIKSAEESIKHNEEQYEFFSFPIIEALESFINKWMKTWAGTFQFCLYALVGTQESVLFDDDLNNF